MALAQLAEPEEQDILEVLLVTVILEILLLVIQKELLLQRQVKVD